MIRIALTLALALALAGCSADTTPSSTSSGADPSTSDVTSSTDASGSSSSSSTTGTLDPASDDASPPPSDLPHTVTFFEIRPIFAANCVSDCHEPDGEYSQLDLGDSARSNLVFVASNGSSLFYVTAGDHEASYLWHKVNGTHATVGGMGSRMPAGADPLPQEDIDLIAEWIDDGAQP